ncbi:MAG: hypothetical protein RJB60_681 [Pseudomonadota bacterium]|jgi:hypothetical protein
MKLFPAISALLALAAAPAIASASVFLDFEQNWDYENPAIDNTYAAQGVAFTNVSGLSNDSSFTYYTNAPSPVGIALASLDGPAYINVAAGVDSSIEFFYTSSAAVTGAIKAYSDLNGTGTLLGTFNFAANDLNTFTDTDGTVYPVLDTWTKGTFNFGGVAKSFDLSATAGVAGFDNLTISAVPEPESYALGLVGLGLVGAIARRRQQA